MSIKERLDKIDIRGAMHVLNIDEANAELFKKRVHEENDSELCLALENASQAFLLEEKEKKEEEFLKKAAAEARLAALGLTKEDLKLILEGN